MLAATDGRAHIDYGYHLAPMTSGQVDEIDWLAGEAGIASFKYYMFYKGLNLAGDSEDADAFTMSDDKYDFGHLYSMMEQVAAADARRGEDARISLSLHCENAELIKLFMARTQAAARAGRAGVARGAAAVDRAPLGARGGDPRRRDALPRQPAPPLERRGAARRARGAVALPVARRPLRDDAPPPRR